MPMKIEDAPIYDMLVNHHRRGAKPFHVPGHKQRADWQAHDADSRYQRLLELDVTELADTDDLHHPAGPIAEAERLAAHCFGAEETCLLVGGSTAGNLAMILGTAAPGELLIVQRNVHRSVFHGLMLAGVQAVLLEPETDDRSGLAVIPHARRVQAAIDRYPEAKGVLLGSPNYYGMSGDLRQIAHLCHAAGIPLLVDEAHGPHYGQHSLFPESALQAGADIVVQSAHKMLSAMTMGAMLHMQGASVRREAIRQALRMVQSSSPSFPLLASLDLARRQLHVEGAAAFASALETAAYIREALPQTAFRLLEYVGERNESQRILQDPLKIVLYDPRSKMSGFRIRDELADRGCVAEMADSRFAVLALGTGSRVTDAEQLIRALSEMSGLSDADKLASPEAKPVAMQEAEAPRERRDSEIPPPVLLSRILPDTVRIPLEESAGKTAGEWIVPYPPGIPELYPGERITERTVERLLAWRQRGASVQGAEDAGLQWIRVAATP